MKLAHEIKVGDELLLEVGRHHSYETYCKVLHIETQFDMWDSNKITYRFKVFGMKIEFFTKAYFFNERLTLK